MTQEDSAACEPLIVTRKAEAAVLIAAGFKYELLSEEPLRLRFPAAARAATTRRRRQYVQRLVNGAAHASREKRFLPAAILDRM